MNLFRILFTLGFILIPGLLISSQAEVSRSERLIEVPGTRCVVRLQEGDGRPLAEVSRDGGSSFVPLKPPRTRLMFKYGPFDPLETVPAIPGHLRAKEASRLFVVQFHTQSLEEYRQGLRDLGVEVRSRAGGSSAR